MDATDVLVESEKETIVAEPLDVVACLPVLDQTVHFSAIFPLLFTLHNYRTTLSLKSYTAQDAARNMAVIQGRDKHRQEYGQEPDYYLFLDDDTVLIPEHAIAVARFIGHGVDIVSAACRQKGPPFSLTFGWFGEDGHCLPAICENGVGDGGRWTPGELVEVDWTGFGFSIINAEIFRAMPQPWFVSQLTDSYRIGQDIHFCQKAAKLGARIFVDTSVEIGHMGATVWPELQPREVPRA